MQQLFYCQKDGDQAEGPYTWPEIQQLRTKNIIRDDTPIRQEHCDTWVPYHRIVIFVKPSLKRSLEFPNNPTFTLLCLIAVLWVLLGLWTLFIGRQVAPQAFSMSLSTLTMLSSAAFFCWLASSLKWFVAFLQSSRKILAEANFAYLYLIATAWGILGIWTVFADQGACGTSWFVFEMSLIVLTLFSAAAFYHWLASSLKWFVVFVESSRARSFRPACALFRLISALWIIAGIWMPFALFKSYPSALTTYISVLGLLSTAAFFYWLASILKWTVVLIERRAKQP